VNFADIKTAAITEFLHDGGTSTDNFTPTMVARWWNEGLMEIWRQLIQMDLNWFNFRDRTITLTGATSYALPSDVARIVNVYLVNSNQSYSEVFPMTQSGKERYDLRTQLIPNVGSSESGLYWGEVASTVDGSGNFIRNIEILPNQTSGTINYDGQRYPTQIAVPPVSETTTYPDLPPDLHWGLVLIIKKYAMDRDVIDSARAWNEFQAWLVNAVRNHKTGLQKQHSKRVVRTRW
jgi:hypothetical protein